MCASAGEPGLLHISRGPARSTCWTRKSGSERISTVCAASREPRQAPRGRLASSGAAKPQPPNSAQLPGSTWLPRQRRRTLSTAPARHSTCWGARRQAPSPGRRASGCNPQAQPPAAARACLLAGRTSRTRERRRWHRAPPAAGNPGRSNGCCCLPLGGSPGSSWSGIVSSRQEPCLLKKSCMGMPGSAVLVGPLGSMRAFGKNKEDTLLQTAWRIEFHYSGP